MAARVGMDGGPGAPMGVFWGTSAAGPSTTPEKLAQTPAMRVAAAHASDASAPNLRAVLKTIVAALRREMAKPLTPFDMRFLSQFAPESVQREHADYFRGAEAARRARQRKEAQERMFSVIGKVDDAAGGPSVYPFDRTTGSAPRKRTAKRRQHRSGWCVGAAAAPLSPAAATGRRPPPPIPGRRPSRWLRRTD